MTRESEVDAIMAAVPTEYRSYWCESRACSCMGCANRCGGAGPKMTAEEHAAWVKRQPAPVPEPEPESDTRTGALWPKY